MKSPYVSELQPNQTVQGTFLVLHKDIRQKKSGDVYLSLTLADRTGELDAKMWDNAAEVAGAFERDDFVRIKGLLQVFQNRPQLSVHKLQAVPESEVELGDYLPASKRDREEMFRELEGWIGQMTNPHLKELLERLFADPAVALAYRTAPAAKTVHHNWLGGLIEHVLSLCQLARFTAQHYPEIDFDLLLAGVILHDVGKIRELEYARSIRYSDQGQLLGHIQIGAQMVLEEVRGMPDFPPKLRDLLVHLILSHHGQLDYGSPKVPVFPEALLLHHLDNLDSKMEAMRALIERDPLIAGSWTGYSPSLERTALKKEKYLASPVASSPASPPSAAVPGGNQPPEAGHRPDGHQRKEPAPSPFAAKLSSALKREP